MNTSVLGDPYDLLDLVAEPLSRLTDEERHAWIDYRVLGLSQRQIALAEGRTYQAISLRLGRADAAVSEVLARRRQAEQP